jgi:hypothetical protein
MRNDVKCLESKGIETNHNSILNKQLKSGKYTYIKKILQAGWQKILKVLLADPTELKVWQKVDRQGNNYWCAYDPKTGKSYSSGSEADLYIWIEQVSKSYNYARTDFSNW